MKTYYIIVSGDVQGVFFRASAKEKADELGIVGYAKNLPDGDVEIVAQGREEALEHLISWCNHGPESATVENVEAEEMKNDTLYDAFSVK